jgi:predicted adenine nucleotide alpha hydrolase (AANH) superfamily ATPase
MITRLFSLVLCLQLATISFAKKFEKFEDAFVDFCAFKKIEYLITPDFKKEINEKKAFLVLHKNAHIVQFGRYNTDAGKEIYIFNYFADTSYLKAGIITGCYTYENDLWVEVTDQVMPLLNFKDFYGPNIAPPKKYMHTVQFRYELHKNDFIKLIIEPYWDGNDEKKDRIFEQKKYSALQLKWNKKAGKFEINKWLR